MRCRSHDLALLLAPLLALAGLAGVAGAQVSPGPLSTAHAKLDGALQCFQCHAKGGATGAMDQRCLACHTEVAWMRQRARGFHATVAKQPCASCHPDHGGRDFRLVAWDGGTPEKFDHRRAGWALEGKHATVACRDCHEPQNQKSGATALLRKVSHADSWLGLETACASCHADPHRGQLGAACASCHGVAAWKPAPGFDHAKTRYPLTGAHVPLACAACHSAPAVATTRDAQGRPIPQWKPLPFAECSACHRDPHAGRFGAACASCHSTGSFKTINSRGFDHGRTRYPLRGAHVTVACATCHDPKLAWGPKPKFTRCTDCHRDAHAGQGTLAGVAVDCASCHDVRAFRPSTFTAENHARTTYPLVGRHARTACDGCHARLPAGTAAAAALGPARVRLHPTAGACTDCHGDPHGGRLPRAKRAGRPATGNAACLACHTLDGFHPSRVDAAAHAVYAYPLEGAHRAVPCQDCHAELRAAPAASTLIAAAATMHALTFERKATACADCHETPHGDQFATRKDGGACERCHGLEAFRPASAFDHSRDAAFKLEGAHARTPCLDCHRPTKDADGRIRPRWRPLPSSCESCHAPEFLAPKKSSALPFGPIPTARFAVRSHGPIPLTTREASHASGT